MELLALECLLCPTGFPASLAVKTSVTTAVPPIQGTYDDVVATFSDSLSHASIVDGIRLSRRQSKVDFEIYKHGDMDHLNQLLDVGCQECCGMPRGLYSLQLLFFLPEKRNGGK